MPDMSAMANLQATVASPPPPAANPTGVKPKPKRPDIEPTVLSGAAMPDPTNTSNKTLLGQ